MPVKLDEFEFILLDGFLHAPSYRECVRPSIGPSVNRFVTPPLRRVLGASCAAYPALFLSRVTPPISHRVGRSVSPSVGLSHIALFAFLGILRVGNVVFEHAPAQINTAPAQIITAPAQLITAPAQPPATEVVVYMALFTFRYRNFGNCF